VPEDHRHRRELCADPQQRHHDLREEVGAVLGIILDAGPHEQPEQAQVLHVASLRVFRCSGVRVFRTGKVKDKPVFVGPRTPEHLNT